MAGPSDSGAPSCNNVAGARNAFRWHRVTMLMSCANDGEAAADEVLVMKSVCPPRGGLVGK